MRNKLLTITFLIVCFAADAYAFVAQECRSGSGWSFLQTAEAESGPVMSDLTKDDITLGQPFSFHVALCDTKKDQPDRVTATAIMPAHQHGMNYTPTVTFDVASQTYKIKDFLFHMPGQWTVNISTYTGDFAVHYSQNITIN
ncbi:hypothetical protein [Leucothrix arctica]|uniref:YtkA-like domain-containing protein n=1 Tax=Leucothrix arctica TaxID=1481894 RepID=A0A317C9T4_9GAMM|nr:hypothetical protein [Leucothrix arctica]PWQ95296.1 hypothetical protein DKT75_13205 [Leucothrix arctica]